MFPEQFRKRIEQRKYAKWAKDLTEDQLEALLCAVGEFGYRAFEPLRILHRHSPKDSVSHARAVLALEILAEFAFGKPTTLEPLRKRFSQAMEDLRRAMKRPIS